MKYLIGDKYFNKIDILDQIPSKDSFTHSENKIGTGSGAWEWHVGSKNDPTRYEFFGGRNFSVRSFLKKADLIWLLQEMQTEYFYPSFPYREMSRFKEIWKERLSEIETLEEICFFQFQEHDGRNSNDDRLYAKRPGVQAEGDNIYGIIRKLSIPNVTYCSILKLISEDGEILYYFKIFPVITTSETLSLAEEEIVSEIEHSPAITPTERTQLIKSRIGQGKFRVDLLEEFRLCPISGVDDTRLLIASHIKPWHVSNNYERLYVKNGLLFTPTYDKLFDYGLISFTINKNLLVSPWISAENKKHLNLIDNRNYPNLPVSGREDFLEYHRSYIFKV